MGLAEANVQALQWAAQNQQVVKALDSAELAAIEASLARQFRLEFETREIATMFNQHMTEIIAAGQIAKQQMESTIGGESAGPNQIVGPIPIRAGFLGIGDDWEDGGASITTGSAQNWLHSGTTLLGGTAGNPIRIGQNAVFCIVGLGSLSPAPKVESIKFTVDGKEKTVLYTGYALKNSGLKVKDLNAAMVWKENTTVLGTIFASANHGATVTDYLYLIGVMYVREAQGRVQDPYSICGSSANRDVNKVVYTT